MSADDAWNDPGWKQAALDHVDQVKKDANGKTGNDLGAILGRKLAEQRAEQEARIKEMAARDPVAYDQNRRKWAKDLGIRTAALDKLVRQIQVQAEEKDSALPHWQVDPSDNPIDGADLLADLERVFVRYIYLPKGASVALALWTLHAWTAGIFPPSWYW